MIGPRQGASTAGSSGPQTGADRPDPSKVEVLLIRHASAGHRNGSSPDDTTRRLDAKGRASAQRIAEAFGEHGVLSISSSPIIRCVETVEALAASTGHDIRIVAMFGENSPPDGSWAALEDVVGQLLDDSTIFHGGPRRAVICSHGDIIPDLLRLASLRGTRFKGRSGNAKASVWRLTGWDGATFATADYTAPDDVTADQF
ncbi:MAG: phosphoglycerate mutase family protein [Microthrixaceae bacterium]